MFCSPILWRHFLNWSYLFLDDFALFQANIKLLSNTSLPCLFSFCNSPSFCSLLLTYLILVCILVTQWKKAKGGTIYVVLLPIMMVYFFLSVLLGQNTWQRQLQEEQFILAEILTVQLIMVGKPQLLDCRASGDTVVLTKKQTQMNAIAQVAFLFLCSLKALPMLWYFPHSWWGIFLLQ